MDMQFGSVDPFEDIAGYSIRAGLTQTTGIQQWFLINVLLRTDSNQNLKDLPQWKEDGSDQKGEETLTIYKKDKQNGSVIYEFPEIQFKHSESLVTDRHQYHLLHYAYGKSLTKDLPGISITNKDEPGRLLAASRSKGKVGVGKDGEPSPLLGYQCIQSLDGGVGFRMISERCKTGGWLEVILEQNKNHCHRGDAINFVFVLNDKDYACRNVGDNPGMTFLTYEEYFGLCLEFPTIELQTLLDELTPQLTEHRLDDLLDFKPITGLKHWQGVGMEKTGRDQPPDSAVEICTVVSNRPSARMFDWRPSSMKQTAAAES